jgi:hypothetical protein
MRAHQPAGLQLATHICPVAHLAGADAFFLPAANAESETNASERHAKAAISVAFIVSSSVLSNRSCLMTEQIFYPCA